MSLHVNEGVYSEEDQARSMDQQVRDENRGSLATMGQQVINANNPISEEQVLWECRGQSLRNLERLSLTAS